VYALSAPASSGYNRLTGNAFTRGSTVIPLFLAIVEASVYSSTCLSFRHTLQSKTVQARSRNLYL